MKYYTSEIEMINYLILHSLTHIILPNTPHTHTHTCTHKHTHTHAHACMHTRMQQQHQPVMFTHNFPHSRTRTRIPESLRQDHTTHARGISPTRTTHARTTWCVSVTTTTWHCTSALRSVTTPKIEGLELDWVGFSLKYPHIGQEILKKHTFWGDFLVIICDNLGISLLWFLEMIPHTHDARTFSSVQLTHDARK